MMNYGIKLKTNGLVKNKRQQVTTDMIVSIFVPQRDDDISVCIIFDDKLIKYSFCGELNVYRYPRLIEYNKYKAPNSPQI